jgi:hypothetical protein
MSTFAVTLTVVKGEPLGEIVASARIAYRILGISVLRGIRSLQVVEGKIVPTDRSQFATALPGES